MINILVAEILLANLTSVDMDEFVIRTVKKEDAKNTSGEWFSSTKKPKSQPATTKLEKRDKNVQKKRQATSQEDTSSSRTPDITKDVKKVMKKLWTPNFKKEYEEIALESFNKENDVAKLKSKGGIIRDTEVRSKIMHGYDCRCCAPYYDALGLSPGERQRRVNEVSRHRAFEAIPPTPERYWDVQFPNEEVQKEMGAVHVSNSPFFKGIKCPKPPLSPSTIRPSRKSKRKIFDSGSDFKSGSS